MQGEGGTCFSELSQQLWSYPDPCPQFKSVHFAAFALSIKTIAGLGSTQDEYTPGACSYMALLVYPNPDSCL